MTPDPALERLPMTMGYFRLLLRGFGDTPQRRAAILAGAGVSEAALTDPAADISLFQQVRQVDNLNALLGEGWAFANPDIWSQASHGALGVAALAAPDLAGTVEVIARYTGVRTPYAGVTLRRGRAAWTLQYVPFVQLTALQGRAITEATFLSIRAVMAAVLGRPAQDVRWAFVGQEPAYAERVRATLGGEVAYGAEVACIVLPAAELANASPFADPSLYARAVEELEAALRRLSEPFDLKARMERLLATMPPGRLDSLSAARALGVSRRTLVRRLAEAGVGYRDLLDQELRRRARRLLDAGELSHAEIAERLGYAEATSFSRACRRWFGRPAERRQGVEPPPVQA
jgi:AraC-like DNA-binding protein